MALACTSLARALAGDLVYTCAGPGHSGNPGTPTLAAIPQEKPEVNALSRRRELFANRLAQAEHSLERVHARHLAKVEGTEGKGRS
jgi:hypothetical protein